MEFKEVLQKIHNKEKALSYSSLSAFLKSPRHYFGYVMNKETTPAMEEGKRFHMALLEPEEFEKTYYVFDDTEKINELLTKGCLDSKGNHVIPKTPRSTKAYKDWKISELSKYVGKEEVSKAEYDIYQEMIKVLSKHSVCKDLLFGEGGENEVPFEYEESNFKITGKIDRRTKDYTLDLKKVADASFQKVKWDIERMNYDLQSVIYSKANRTIKHYLVYVDKGANVTVVEITPETLQRYEDKYNFALESFSRCLEEDKWGYSYDFWQDLIRI